MLVASADVNITSSTKLAIDASNAAGDASSDANKAITAANGKNKNFYGSSTPVGAVANDLWYKPADDGNYLVYQYDGTQWNATKFNNAIFNNIDAAKISVINLTAASISSLNGLNVGNGQFTVDGSGNVKFKGDLTGASGTFSGAINTATSVYVGNNVYIGTADSTNVKKMMFLPSGQNSGNFFYYDPYIDYIGVNSDNLIQLGIASASNYGNPGTYIALQSGEIDITAGLINIQGTMYFENLSINNNSIYNNNGALYLNGAGAAVLEDNSSGATLTVTSDGAGQYVNSPAVYSRTTTSTSNVVVTVSGNLARSTSARKYKLDEQPVDNTLAYKILDVVPKTWFDRNASEQYASLIDKQYGINPDGTTTTPQTVTQKEWDSVPFIERIPGVVAEDVEAAGLSQYLVYTDPDVNGNREIEGVQYDRLWTLLIPPVKDLKQNMDTVLEQNTSLILKNADLENRIAILEQKMGAA